MLDLQAFIESENEKIFSYITSRPDSFVEPSFDPSWASEQILELFEKWTTGITRTIMRQDVLNQSKSSRSRNHVKPDVMHSPVLHGTIKSVTFYKRTGSAVVDIQQNQYELVIKAALHGALVPFLERRLITEGRAIHFANIRFSNEVLIPNQLCVVDLKKTKEDINFVIKCTETTSLKNLNEDDPPYALLLRVEGPTKNGIFLTDGEYKIELFLDDDRKSLKLLLRFGDVIVFHQPWLKEMSPGILSLIYGPNSVMFRVPVSVQSKDPLSQISQHAPNLSQDGLLFRNSAACRSIRGTVINIEHKVDYGAWASSLITLLDSNERKVNISVKAETSSYDVMKAVSEIRPSHFIWLFGLIETSSNVISFTNETTVFNTSLLCSIIASNVVVPKALKIRDNFTTFVTRAVIVNITCEAKKVHKICHTLVPFNSCPVCNYTLNDDEMESDFLISLDIDDSSCDPVTVYGNGSKFPFWTVKTGDWVKFTPEKKKKIKNSILGQEYIFVLSIGNEREFCGFGDDNVWRVDQCIRPVGDVEREVRLLKKWHQKLDNEDSKGK